MKHFLQPRTRRVVEPHQQSAGFTLVELLVAVAITGIVITAAGLGLVTVLQANKKAEAATNRRIELNRALDFMAEEVKMARAISVNPEIDVHSSMAPNFDSDCDNPSGGVDCGLILEIPGVSERVIYYVQSSPAGSPWLGPRVIYRWGPDFNANGTYSNPISPASWNPKPLVDRIEGNLQSPNSDCPTGWSPNLSADDRDSFYACVDPTGKIAEVFLLGEVQGAYGRAEPHYVASTRVFARSAAISTTCTVPSIINMTIKENPERDTAVQDTIINANLVPAGTVTSAGGLSKKVQSQNPPGGTQVSCGSTVAYEYTY